MLAKEIQKGLCYSGIVLLKESKCGVLLQKNSHRYLYLIRFTTTWTGFQSITESQSTIPTLILKYSQFRFTNEHNVFGQ